MTKEELGKFDDDYSQKILIDQNKFFRIYEAKNIKEKRECCLKIIDKDIFKPEGNADLNEFIENEVNITKHCDSENTINFYGKKESNKSIIFEFDKYKKDLSKYLQENVSFKDEEDKKFFKQIIRDLTKGLKTIHEKGVIHRNIQPSSIFIVEIEEEGKDEVKIGEFGNAIFKEDNKFEQIGSPFYAAPEIILNKEYDEKCDLWSLGIILYESYFEHLPYGENVDENIIMNTFHDYYNKKGFIFEKTRKASLDILFNCLLQIEPEKRISTDELYKLVFDEDFMKNDDKFLAKDKKYRNIYNTISKEKCDEKKFKSGEIKEVNNKKTREKQNCENIVPFVLHLTNIMDFANNMVNNGGNNNANANSNSNS